MTSQTVSRETRERLVVGVRRLKEPMKVPAETRVLTVANQKGGVGKTTSTVNLAAALAMGGLRVLVIDLDPQGNASTALGVDHHSEGVEGMFEVLVEDKPFSEVLVKVAATGFSCQSPVLISPCPFSSLAGYRCALPSRGRSLTKMRVSAEV